MRRWLLPMLAVLFAAAHTHCATADVRTTEGEAATRAAVEPRSVALATPLHFLAADGQDVVVGPGAFRVEASPGPQLRLTGEKGGTPLMLAAHSTEHDLEVSEPFPVLLQPEEDFHLILLQPGGTALDAVGSASGIRSRGTFAVPLDKSRLSAQLKVFKSYTITPILTSWGFGPCVRPWIINHISINSLSVQLPGVPLPQVWPPLDWPIPGASCTYTSVLITSPWPISASEINNYQFHVTVPMYDHQTSSTTVTMTARHDYYFDQYGFTSQYRFPQVILGEGREPLSLGMPQTVQTVAGVYASRPAGSPVRFELRDVRQSQPIAVANCTLRATAAGTASLTCP